MKVDSDRDLAQLAILGQQTSSLETPSPTLGLRHLYNHEVSSLYTISILMVSSVVREIDRINRKQLDLPDGASW